MISNLRQQPSEDGAAPPQLRQQVLERDATITELQNEAMICRVSELELRQRLSDTMDQMRKLRDSGAPALIQLHVGW